MKNLTPAQKSAIIKIEADKFKSYAQGLNALAALEGGSGQQIAHQLAESMLSQIENSAATVRALIAGKHSGAMKSLTRYEIIALAEKYALPDASPRVTYDLTEHALLQLVSEIVIRAGKEWGMVK